VREIARRALLAVVEALTDPEAPSKQTID